MLFQIKRTAIIIHCCHNLAKIKCKCSTYSALCPPVKRLGRQNMTMLTCSTPPEFFREVFQCILAAERPNESYECGLKIMMINKKKYSLLDVKNAYSILIRSSTSILSIPCGLKVQSSLTPSQQYNVSPIEHAQALNDRRFENTAMNDILTGIGLDEPTTKLLSVPISDLTLSLVRIFEYFLPIPTANVTSHPRWKTSVFRDLDEQNCHFISATRSFNLKMKGKLSVNNFLFIFSDLFVFSLPHR